MKKRFQCVAGFLFVIVLTSVFAADGTDGMPTTLKADDLAVVAAGEIVYQAQCASCHGQYLEGQANWRSRDDNGFLPAPPHDATGHTWHHADDLLFEITKYGPGVVINDTNYKTQMPAFQNILSDADIVAVLSFIKNTWPEEERDWQDQVNGSQKGALGTLGKKKTKLDELLNK